MVVGGECGREGGVAASPSKSPAERTELLQSQYGLTHYVYTQLEPNTEILASIRSNFEIRASKRRARQYRKTLGDECALVTLTRTFVRAAQYTVPKTIEIADTNGNSCQRTSLAAYQDERI